jgi:MFS family permease
MKQLFPAAGDPNVRRYLIGQIVSVIGSWTQNITLNLVAYQLSGSPAVLGLLNFLLFGPAIVVAPVAGSRVTAVNARRTTTAMLLCAMLVAALLLGLSVTHKLTIGWLLVLAAMAGFLGAIELPARQVLLTSSVADASMMSNAVAMNTLAFNIGRMVGPALAAVVFAQLGARYGFALNIAGLAFMLWSVQKVVARALPEGEAAVRGSLREAIAYIRNDRLASLFFPVVACLGLFGSAYQTLVPVLADKAFGSAAAYTGVFFGSAGAGSLAAAAVLSSRFSSAMVKRLLVVTPWVAVLALLGIGTAGDVSMAALSFFVLGFSMTFTAPGTNANLQHHAPSGLRGALGGLYVMSFMGLIPFGQLLAGALAQVMPVRSAVLVIAASLGAGLLALFAPRWKRNGRISLDADDI